MSEDMNEHTPLPWRVRDGRDRHCGIWIDAPEAIVDNDRGPHYTRQILEDEDYHEKLADAELIVTAVNERPTLLARVRELEEALRETTEMLQAALSQSQAWGISLAVNAAPRIAANRAALADR